MIPGYDAWKTRAPEDEPGYWSNRSREIDEPEDDEPDPVEEDERAVVEAAERAAEC